MNRETQKIKLLGHMARGLPLTRRIGMVRYGIGNVPARIEELRQDGHNIKTTMRKVRSGSRVGFYTLIKE